MKKIKWFAFLLLFIPSSVFASDITKSSSITLDGTKNAKIVDMNENTYITIKKDSLIEITSDIAIDSIYIVYERASKEGVITKINGEKTNKSIGENGFLHEYIKISEKDVLSLTLKYNEDVKIADIYVLDAGELPDYIEVWNPPLDNNSDLLLFSTHSDDEQLFFLGLMPTYVARGANVQVVYFTNHYDNTKRLHEQLHGLYTVGIRNYPIIGIVPDAYSKSLDGALSNLKNAKLTEEDIMKWEVEMIRRFKPSVVVGHDEAGEYSHGQHILNTYILKNAITNANDSNYDKESFEKYGAWDTKKTYLHLYKENKIIMNYDEPLEYFNGLTAYEVSKEGYKKHNTQQWTWFTKWINGNNNEYTKATQIKTYSPLEFGLYRSTVGIDTLKNDMFENIVYRKDQVTNKEPVANENDNSDNHNNTNSSEEKNKKQNYLYYLIGIVIILIILIIPFKTKKHKVLK